MKTDTDNSDLVVVPEIGQAFDLVDSTSQYWHGRISRLPSGDFELSRMSDCQSEIQSMIQWMFSIHDSDGVSMCTLLEYWEPCEADGVEEYGATFLFREKDIDTLKRVMESLVDVGYHKRAKWFLLEMDGQESQEK